MTNKFYGLQPKISAFRDEAAAAIVTSSDETARMGLTELCDQLDYAITILEMLQDAMVSGDAETVEEMTEILNWHFVGDAVNILPSRVNGNLVAGSIDKQYFMIVGTEKIADQTRHELFNLVERMKFDTPFKFEAAIYVYDEIESDRLILEEE